MRQRTVSSRASATILGSALVMIGGLSAFVPGQEPTKKDTVSRQVSEPEKVVQEQLEAYNRHDIDGFLKTYSPDIKLYDFPDKKISSGIEAMRENYGKFFKREPQLKARIAKRIVQGDFVIDNEEIRGIANEFNAVAIYLVKEGKINTVWFLK